MADFPYHGATDRRAETGAFDVIGDVHGCCDELEALLERLGYGVSWSNPGAAREVRVTPPSGRRAVFVGDLVDRGPRSPDVLRIAMAMVADGSGFAVPGNHDHKFRRWLDGRMPHLTHGLDRTVAQVQAEPAAWRRNLQPFLVSLPPFLWLDAGRLVVAHAGILHHMLEGTPSQRTQRFCIFGDTDGKVDENGLSIRYDWTPRYEGDAHVVYGHVPVADPAHRGRTVCIDTACCYGGRLTALRWPEMEVVSVPARDSYWWSSRELGLPAARP